ncbi:DUF2220 family protein [Arthrobacter alpinus]|nr:DUF2220 family protein [Arthrobacter alpinus]
MGARQWASLGRQSVPERLVLNTPADVAHFCGRETHWNRLTQRLALLVDHPGPGFESGFADAAARSAGVLAGLPAVDFDRLLGVLTWLRSNPDSGLYVRQLPIRGVDTKWVGAHRGLVERLHAAATGAVSLGLAAVPDLVRARFLDPGLAPGGLDDIAATVASLAALEIAPRTVYVFENLESVLAMPPIPGAVVIHGSGYAVDRLAGIPWMCTALIVYWGDLDSHGFAILNRFRASGLSITTALMDLPTLELHQDLCVTEPKPAAGIFSHLLPGELDMVAELAARGNVRLEQERLDWSHALSVLRAAAPHRQSLSMGEAGTSCVRAWSVVCSVVAQPAGLDLGPRQSSVRAAEPKYTTAAGGLGAQGASRRRASLGDVGRRSQPGTRSVVQVHSETAHSSAPMRRHPGSPGTTVN